jgi:hypothetical protein
MADAFQRKCRDRKGKLRRVRACIDRYKADLATAGRVWLTGDGQKH